MKSTIALCLAFIGCAGAMTRCLCSFAQVFKLDSIDTLLTFCVLLFLIVVSATSVALIVYYEVFPSLKSLKK